MRNDGKRIGVVGRVLLLTALLSSSSFCGTLSAGELDIARQALRDGLWEVARTHAQQAEGDVARIVILESFAREGRWNDVLSAVDSYGRTEVPEFLYYKAAALYHTGLHAAARRLLESVDFSRGAFAADASLLFASVLRKEGEVDAALAKLDATGDDADSKMLAAAIRKSKGEDREAESLWREVVSMTNAPERAVSIAAANLSDVDTLRHLAVSSSDSEVIRFSGLRLGMILVRSADTFEEGAKLIRKIASDSPDFRGAKSAFLVLADAELSRGDYAAAGAAYREAMETWPETAKEPSVRLGLGWALSESARRDEALVELAAVQSLATDDETLALALVKTGDVLSGAGKRDEALAKYREAMTKYPMSSAVGKIRDKVAVRDLEQKGREAFAAYRFEEARKIFADVAARDSSMASRMKYCDMVCLYGLGRDVAAEKMAAELSSSSPDPSVRCDASLWLAKFLYNRGRYREAESNFLACAEFSVANPPVLADSLLWAARAAFASGEFSRTVQNATRLDAACPKTRAADEGMLLQAEALIELARFDESVLVAERVEVSETADVALKLKAQLLRADALFAMGADNPIRYREALEAYTSLRSGEQLTPSVRIRLSYKLAKTLERLKRVDEAIDEYYSRVVLAFRDGLAEGIRYDEDAIAAFSRAAFRLAEEYESRGADVQAVNILRLVLTASVPASVEAEKRIVRIHRKGQIL